jgi:hypothetical protein
MAKLPRSDAKLKQLPEETQQRVFDRVLELKRGGGRQNDAIPWIKAEFGVTTSAGALSDFLGWFAARIEARADEQRVEAFLDEERQLHPEISDAELFARGQRAFSLLAIARQDPKQWTSVQQIALNKGAGELNREKLKRKDQELALEREKWNQKLAEIADQKRRIESALKTARTGGLSAEALREIEQAAALL